MLAILAQTGLVHLGSVHGIFIVLRGATHRWAGPSTKSPTALFCNNEKYMANSFEQTLRILIHSI